MLQPVFAALCRRFWVRFRTRFHAARTRSTVGELCRPKAEFPRTCAYMLHLSATPMLRPAPLTLRRVAQRQSAGLTSRWSQVQSLSRLLETSMAPAAPRSANGRQVTRVLFVVVAAALVLGCKKKEQGAPRERQFYCATSAPRECLPTRESCEKASDGTQRTCVEAARAYCFSKIAGDIKNPDRRVSLCFTASRDCESLSKALKLMRSGPTSCSESTPQDVWP